MNLSDCPKCRVGSVWNTGVCPVCPAPRMAQERVSEVWAWVVDAKRRQRILERMARDAETTRAHQHYVDLIRAEVRRGLPSPPSL